MLHLCSLLRFYPLLHGCLFLSFLPVASSLPDAFVPASCFIADCCFRACLLHHRYPSLSDLSRASTLPTSVDCLIAAYCFRLCLIAAYCFRLCLSLPTASASASRCLLLPPLPHRCLMLHRCPMLASRARQAHALPTTDIA